MTVKMNPYLVFDGNARDALHFYEKALKANVVGVSTFAQMPTDPNYPLPEGSSDRIAHAHLKVGESDLMLSDTFPGQPHHVGNQVTVMLSTSTSDKAKEIYEALADGGQVQMPLQETFWSPAYGLVTDKFGVTFHVSTEPQQ